MGLRIPHETIEFLMLQLQQAWGELQTEAWKCDKWFNLSKVYGWISRSGVDVIVGIKYLKHYSVLQLMLPSGSRLSIDNAKLLSANGNLAVLSSMHAAWVCDHAQAQLISLRLYMT